MSTSRRGDVIKLPDSLEEINEYFIRNKWGDGLPIIPPTTHRVRKMLRAFHYGEDTVIGNVPPRYGELTLKRLAINAVMAGCKPEYLPLIRAAVEAMLEPRFNLFGTQGTTNPAGVMTIVNGPIAKQLDINSKYNLFGQGWQANATIGRAIRLILVNVGGGIPGIGDMATLGNPNKYTSCFAENEDQSPWDPYHVEQGFRKEDSTVTVITAAMEQDVQEMAADAIGIMNTISGGMMAKGSNCVFHDVEPGIVIGPMLARRIAKDGWTKEKARNYIWENAFVWMDELTPVGQQVVEKWKTVLPASSAGEENCKGV